MTFNLRFGTANDGPNHWDLRKDLVVETIQESAPDIIGTQECLAFQADYIVSKLPEYDWVGLGREVDGTGEMTAVLYRRKALLPIEVSHHWLSETPQTPGSKSWDSSLPRIATRIRFVHGPTQRHFVFYNTHFDHRGAQARLEGAKLLARMAQKEQLPVVLTGDFNAIGGDSDPWKALTEEAFRDAWIVADATEGSANTWNGFKVDPERDDRRIDWILVSDGVETKHCRTLDDQRAGRFPSDHHPVLARLNLGKNAAATR